MSLNRLATPSKISGFVSTFLLKKYDNPVPIPTFHEEMWGICTSGSNRVAIAAPRHHAKSTAVTHALTLYLFLFRIKNYGIIVSDTEGQASQFLGDIKAELIENTDLRDIFGIRRIIKDAVTDIIVECDDGHKFRIQAIGAEQKVRGRKWGNKRPDYIVCDDLENDEIVESDERREKFRNWFLKALVPCLAKGGTIIVVGTILHMDSLLMRLLNNDSWFKKLYKAHEGFDDFSNILWPEQWPEKELRKIRQEYIDDGNSEGYTQEYLNDPISHTEAFFRKADFLEMEEDMRDLPTFNYAAVDFAISDEDRRAYTVVVVGGMDSKGRLMIKHVLRFRGDANEILESIFEIQKLYSIDMWAMEKGQISQTLMGPMYERMNKSGTYLNVNLKVPTKDKRSRARAIQARMRAGGVYFDKNATWFAPFEQELLQFPKGTYKDQVDAVAWLGIAINELSEGPTKEDLDEEDYVEKRKDFESDFLGRNETTGY